MNFAAKYLSALKKTLETIDITEIEEVITILDNARANGNQIFVAGNGGSASTSAHFVTDLVKGSFEEDKPSFRAQSLCDNNSFITALGNDCAYHDIFVGQLKHMFVPGDLVIGISASGNSPNVVRALEYANKHYGFTIALTGFNGGKLAEVANKVLHVPVDHYGLAEDAHMVIVHILSYFFMNGSSAPLPK